MDYSDFDFLWEPVPWQSEYTHVWPSKFHEFSGTFLVPKTGDINYYFHTEVISNLDRPNEFISLVEPCVFDTAWAPHPLDPPFIYVFGNQWYSAEKMPTVEYHVAGATQRKYMTTPKATLLEQHNDKWNTLVDCTWDYSWKPDPGDPPLIYVFGNQWHSAEKMPTVEYTVPGATQRKYMSWPRATLKSNDSNWTIPANIDAADLDLSWVPDPGSPPYIYQFATQHQKTGGPIYTVPGATEVKYLSELKTRTVGKATAIVEIDHLDGNAGQIPNVFKRVRFFDNYRDTLIRIAKSLGTEHEYVWICSSICHYDGFDWSWHPEQWQGEMLHVFPSNDQKFGDTFFMHVPTFAQYAEKKALLEWYDVNYVDKTVPRRSIPIIEHSYDSQADAVKNTDWAGPLAVFTNNGEPMTIPAVSLWRQETKTIMPLSAGASAVIIPKASKGSIKTQLYDYPYIDKTQTKRHGDQPLDIVFIENGEPNAESNFAHLNSATYNLLNRLHRSSGVNGRVAAYQAAAELSKTPWFFAVFAKLQVNTEFDWSWQPDRMQEPKHYIFHAKNPVNGLEYGHQAMIAYNRELVLNNPGVGLDFTLDSPHEVVPILSGTAYYNVSAWQCWRTAFREVIKLKAALPDVEAEYRISRWTLTNFDEINHWSQLGALDAIQYYDEVGGNFDALKKSYEWEWLASYAFVKRGLSPAQ